NQQYLKAADDARLAALVEPELRRRGAQPGAGPDLQKVVALLKERASTLLQLADEAMLLYAYEKPAPQPLGAAVRAALRARKARASTLPQLPDEAMLFYAYEKPAPQPLDAPVRGALRTLKARLASATWERREVGNVIKEVVKGSGLKMPQVAMPLRWMVTGR